LDFSSLVCDTGFKKLFCGGFFSQKLFLNAKETDEISNKKEERTLLESEVRKMN